MDYNRKVGEFGEKLARDYLLKKDYKIISNNLKTSYQEIDIIAKDKQEIVFIEVKTRTSRTYGTADESISDNKIKNLNKAINEYIYKNKIDPEIVRLDLVAIDLNKAKKIAKIKHYKYIL